ncbi:GGDEF domain-containing protein [Xanthomonas sp. XNM01]|uniref:GGDEF domain-containing protein n=1 Tax=Xanthomonas sp. XNM01 TaxID=2769289 RepID=UPI00177B5505|nr:GGDEF domain-containing protein [Xanthomonas sp. XNM01]MBD9369693.1 diguanylate cyclase [Xanthomonas sp. XNM01]
MRSPHGPSRTSLTTTGAPGQEGPSLQAPYQEPGTVLPAFAAGMAALPGELGDLGLRLRSAADEADWIRYARLLRQFLDKYLLDFARSLDAPDAAERELTVLRELLRQTVGGALASLLHPLPALADEAGDLGEAVRQWRTGTDLEPLARRIRELCHQVGLHHEEVDEQRRMLLGLFDLLLENLYELLDDGSWLHGQISVVRRLIADNPDRQALETTRDSLRELVYQQGLLKQGIGESKDALRGMMSTFVERLDGMAASTGEFQNRLESHAAAIREARSIAELGRRLDDVLEDTTRLQAQALRSKEQLMAAREDVDAAEARIAALEAQLRDAGDLVRSDPLTGVLNRRGLDELYAREVARAEREGQPLSLALLDMDQFRRFNERFGHAGGDAALRHVVQVLRDGLRAGDALARLGGEEFVLLLPGSPLAEAVAAVQRLQRELAGRALVLDGATVEVAFSAGVAARQLGESQDSLFKRADAAMYASKHAGRNRVTAAQ